MNKTKLLPVVVLIFMMIFLAACAQPITVTTSQTSSGTITSPTAAPAGVNPLVSIEIDASSPVNLGLGFAAYLVAMGKYSDGSMRNVSSQVVWSSSDPAVASVSRDGVFTGKSVGDTEITAELDGMVSKPVTMDVYVETRTPITP